MAAAAVDNRNSSRPSACLDDPNFATICSFIDKFGQACNLGDLPFDYLQEMLENTDEVPPRLAQIHIQLMRRVYRSINTEKWEKHLSKFGHSYNAQDGWEIERFGYKKAKLQTKLRILKTLLEAQFDYNVKFKSEVNKLEAEDLRRQPIGRDSEGQLYWYQVDPDANLRIYREDIDDETWEIVASNREEMLQLIEDLNAGIVKRNNIDETVGEIENGSGEVSQSPKGILLDTGKEAAEETERGENEEDDDDDDEAMQIDESYSSSTVDDNKKSVPESDISKTNKSTLPVTADKELSESKSEEPEPEVRVENTETILKQEIPKPILIPDNILSNSVQQQNLEQLNNLNKSESEVTATDSCEKVPESVSADKQPLPNPVIVVPPKTVSNDSVDSANNSNSWNPVEVAADNGTNQESSRTFIDNLKLEAKNRKSHHKPKLEKSSNSGSGSSRGIKMEPSPLGNLMAFTQMMGSKRSTMSENLKKVTDIEEDGSEQVGTKSEPFIKPDIYQILSRQKDYNPNPIESSNFPLPVPVPVQSIKTKTEYIKPPEVIIQSNKVVPKPEPEIVKNESAAPVGSKESTLQDTEIRLDKEPVIQGSEDIQVKEPVIQGSEGIQVKESLIQGSEDIQVKEPVIQGSESIQVKEPVTQGSESTQEKEPVIQGSESTQEKQPLIQDTEDSAGVESLGAPINDDKVNSTTTLLIQEKQIHTEATAEIPLEAPPIQIGITPGTQVKEPVIQGSESTQEKEPLIQDTEDSAGVESLGAPINDDKDNTPSLQVQEKQIHTEATAEIPVEAPPIQIESTPGTQVKEPVIQGSESTQEKEPLIQDTEDSSTIKSLGAPIDDEKDKITPSLLVQEKQIHTEAIEAPSIITEIAAGIQVKEPVIQGSESTQEMEPLIQDTEDSSTIKSLGAPINDEKDKITPSLQVQEKQTHTEAIEAHSIQIETTAATQVKEPVVQGSEGTQEKEPLIQDTEDSFAVKRLEKPIKDDKGKSTPSLLVQEKPIHTEATAEIPVEAPPVQLEITPPCLPTLEAHIPDTESTPSVITQQEQVQDIGINPSLPSQESQDLGYDSQAPITQESTLKEAPVLLPDPSRDKDAKKVELDETKAEVVEPPVTKSTAWLVGYEDSSDEDICSKTSEENSAQLTNATLLEDNKNSEPDRTLSAEDLKRKANADPNLDMDTSTEKRQKLDAIVPSAQIPNPIVGEAIEEEMIIITGEGSGAELQGANDISLESTSQEEVPKGKSRSKSNKSSPSKGRPSGSRRKSFGVENDLTPTERSVTEINGSASNERPVRQSRRIAQIREKEEEQRRRLEEEQLAQLKQAQLQKKQKEKERESQSKKFPKTSEKIKGKTHTEYLPSPSASESDAEEDDDFEIAKGKKRGPKGKKNGEEKFKKGAKPWLNSSSDDEDENVEEEEVHEEEDEEEFLLKSDHEFSPESDLGEDEESAPSRHARTVKIGPQATDKYATTVCEKCTKGDHPEWILLCDMCDKGWHASCIRPQLWVIPEGEWLCPPCQHNKLIEKLGESLVEFDKLLKKRDSDEMRRKRLVYVGISTENILPPEKKSKQEMHATGSNFKKRRRILSEEEDSENDTGFINDREEGDESSRYNSDEDSDDGPMYRLRARRTTKPFNFKEYDEMINSALREEDEYGGEVAQEVKSEPLVSEEVADIVLPKVEVAGEQQEVVEEAKKEEEEEDIDEEEKKRLQELEKASHRKARRRLNDLDATSEEDTDEDFQGSADEDDEDEENLEEDESEWSGDREADDSDGSIVRRGRRGTKEKRREYGRKETYMEVGSVRRSTRRCRSKIQYDESDQESDEDDIAEQWNSEESEESLSASGSDDDTWGKKKKQKKLPPPSRSKMQQFVLPNVQKNKRNSRKKKKKDEEDDVDRPWNKAGSKVRKTIDDSVQQRTTRGKKINFKDILESGESDDDGNIRPKRKKPVPPPLSDDSDGPSSSKKLAAELSAANLRADILKERKNSQEENISKDPQPLVTEKNKPSELEKQLLSPKLENGKAPALMPVLPTLLKPVPAPPYPPVKNQLLEALKKTANDPMPLMPKSQVSQPPSTNLLMSEILASPPIKSPVPASAKKSLPPPPGGGSPSSMSPRPSPSPGPSPNRGMSPQHLPGNMVNEIPRIPDPLQFQRMQAITRAFHPAWGRGPAPPPSYRNHTPISQSPPATTGKPPPLNSIPFMSQSSTRSPYPTPPPLRIPTPNPGAPLQSFHQFKRDVGLPMYRLPPNLPGLPPRSNLLPQMHPGIGHPLERFYGPTGPFGVPPGYGIPPPHSQSQPLFSAPQSFDFRPDEMFKEDHQGLGGPTGVISHIQGGKDEINPAAQDGEFGGLVSYFSSQRGDDDMDT